MTNENRRAAMGRIRALLAKTVQNGCTEEEAMAASQKAGELMDKYGVESSEVDIRAERCDTRSHSSRAGKKGDRERSTQSSEVSLVAVAIGRYCGCRVWRSGPEIKYFGLPHEAEIAAYMTDAIETAMRTSFRAWRKGPERPQNVNGRALRGAFMVAMARRLSERLDEMTQSRNAATPKTTDGKSLVLIRNAVVEEQFKEMGLKLSKSKKKYRENSAAMSAGTSAADRHEFSAGLRSRSALAIGGQ